MPMAAWIVACACCICCSCWAKFITTVAKSVGGAGRLVGFCLPIYDGRCRVHVPLCFRLIPLSCYSAHSDPLVVCTPHFVAATDTMARTKVPRVHDRLRFRFNEAEAHYAHYAREKVKGGRKVDLAELALFNVERAFSDMGWLPVITYDACTCPDLVRQFYCNLQVVGDYNDVERGDELRITSYVKGVDVSFDYRQLVDLLGISYAGPMVFYAPGEPQFFSLQMRAEIDSQLI
ncbi:hypothetical protein NE237_007147 [Protea cynaroides]|uniref:Uncharacterized protein n=1 Tax=Protea cynaroides TaxID=273540 RepID=A0A9Q0KNR3_9MAGN|nr:hypothetical protein NE237_007147 [Protea cynaroides]